MIIRPNIHLINYWQQIEAPQKKFVTFENSVHIPFMEEPNKFLEALQVVVEDVTD